MLFVLDYGVGNIGSVYNALHHLKVEYRVVETANDIENAPKLLFPGVGSFAGAMKALKAKGFVDALRAYLKSNRPFLGVCIGMQVLFDKSEEAPDVEGLGVIPGAITRLSTDLPVPHMGWNSIDLAKEKSSLIPLDVDHRFYFVHSYCAVETPTDWRLATTSYGSCQFTSVVQKGNIIATQFHPEKSGPAGLRFFAHFANLGGKSEVSLPPLPCVSGASQRGLSKRIIACLDVRQNDEGTIVVTKGDQYAVRDKTGAVRDLGSPQEFAKRYYEEGVDELTFLNVTAFRSSPFEDTAMQDVLTEVSKHVFIPLTIGGGIKHILKADGEAHTALEVADLYFRAGADKASIGSDAVSSVEEYIRTKEKTGRSSIEMISEKYGCQAVIISIDPRRVYVKHPSDTTHHTIETKRPDGEGNAFCWYACTTNGGRVTSDIDVVQLVESCEALGAGEILLNSIDHDGSNMGYDLELLEMVRPRTTLPIIVSSGAGKCEHFRAAFDGGADAALAAGIFHRNEISIKEVKDYLASVDLPVRLAGG